MHISTSSSIYLYILQLCFSLLVSRNFLTALFPVTKSANSTQNHGDFQKITKVEFKKIAAIIRSSDLVHLKVKDVLKMKDARPNVARRRIGHPRWLSESCLLFLFSKTGLPDKMLAFFEFLNGFFSKFYNFGLKN